MACDLVVITPRVGTRSETFIRRHIQELLPGKTAVITGIMEPENNRDWEVKGPCLVLEKICGADGNLTSSIIIAAVRDFLLDQTPKAVLCEFLDVSTNFIGVVRDLGIPFYVHGHGYDVSRNLRSRLWQKRYRNLNSANAIFVVSNFAKRALAEFGVDPLLIHVKPCGVDISPAHRRVSDGVVRCLTIGRMVAKKNPVLTLDLFRRASEVLDFLHLDYVGGGPLFESAHQFLTAFGLESRVTLHGSLPHDQAMTLAGQADVFIQHSVVDPVSGDMEGLPVAILEAMAHGLPILATRHAGIPEAVEHGRNGFITDEGDTRTGAEYLLKLAGDPDLRSRLGEAGRHLCRQSFSWFAEQQALLNVMALSYRAEHSFDVGGIL